LRSHRCLRPLYLLWIFGAPALGQTDAGRRPTPAALQSLNPEIGVVGDVVGRASELPPPAGEEDGGIDRFSFREAEIVFGSFVDPFARADFAFVFSDAGESPEIEEGFITLFHLPLGLRGRAGKFRSKIGRANLMDLNALPFVTEPEVIGRYFGEEGFSRTGIQLGRLIPAGPLFLELTGELLDGGRDEEEPLAISSDRSAPTYVAHLRGYGDFTSRSNLEVGLTWVLAGDNRLLEEDPLTGETVPGDPYGTSIYGTDLSYRYRRNRFRALLLRFEGYRVNRDLAGFHAAGTARQDGFYAHSDLRFHPRWSAGLRYDRVEPLSFDVPEPDRARDDVQGYAAYATFEQSEFARIRVQYQRTDEIDGFENDELFLQVRFQIGIDRHGLQ